MTEYKPPPPNLTNSAQASPKASKVIFDWEEWLPYLAEMGGTDEQKRELIETIWQIILTFADLGWEVEDKPQACGQNFDLSAALRAAVVDSNNHQKQNQTEKEQSEEEIL